MHHPPAPATCRDSTFTARHGLHGGGWRESGRSDTLDAATLQVIGELDPAGVRGVLRRILTMFLDSLEPALQALEADILEPTSAKRLRFQAHTLKSAAAQVGAMRLAAACEALERHLLTHPDRAPHLDLDLLPLAESQMTEIIRVQRRLRALLARHDG